MEDIEDMFKNDEDTAADRVPPSKRKGLQKSLPKKKAQTEET